MDQQILRKYFIMGSQNCHTDPIKLLEAAAANGITAFQFREKGEGSLQGNKKIELGKSLRKICRRYGIPFIVNDDLELATILDADGIHVGQEDKPLEEIRKSFPNLLVGLSISNKLELSKSPIHLVDYIGAGPIFPTQTKTDAKTAVGLEWIRYLRRVLPNIPIVGIGGINTDNSHLVIKAGADGVSVISAITKSQNLSRTIRDL